MNKRKIKQNQIDHCYHEHEVTFCCKIKSHHQKAKQNEIISGGLRVKTKKEVLECYLYSTNLSIIFKYD